MTCVLCDAPASAGDVVFEDDDTLVILHNDWSVPGHVMLVSKHHVENPSALDEEQWLRFARLWHRVERAILDEHVATAALSGRGAAEGSGTHMLPSEKVIALKLGIMTPHLHVHLYPFPANVTREEVFAVIDMKTRVPRDEAFVARLQTALLTPPGD